jgi:uroporphyrinogen decarboxylase
MKPKDRILAVLNGNQADRLPVDLWYTPEIGAQLKKHYGAADDYDLYGAMGLDKIVWLFPGYNNPDDNEKTSSQVGAEAVGNRTMWGVPLKKVQSGAAVYHEFGEPPLKDYNKPEQLKSYEFWPDPDRFDYECSKKEAEKVSDKYATIGPWVSFFEIYCQMRGLEQSLMDLMTEPVLVDAILERIEDCQTKMLKKFMETLGDNLDMVFVSDDMGMQQNLLMPHNIWKKFFQSRMKRWCDLIHSYNKKVFYHSDGAVEPLIADLIDCGIDILNPIQHICPGMDIVELKRKYGSKVIFHGGVDNQSVLPFGTPADVQLETRKCIDTLGAGGKGYIVCSCHNVQAGTPIENVIAMVETAKK